MGDTCTVKAWLPTSHLTGSMRRAGVTLSTRRTSYDLTHEQYEAFRADPGIEMELVRDFGRDMPADVEPDEVPEAERVYTYGELDDLTYSELRDVARGRELKQSGAKSELIERVLDAQSEDAEDEPSE